MDQEIIQLILDMGASGSNVEEVRQRLEGLKASAQKAADTYEVLDTVVARSGGVVGTYAVQTRQADAATDAAVAAAVARTAQERAVARAVLDVGDATAKAGINMKAMNQRILELGRASQDFVQGGFAGIANNLERIVGGSGLAAGVVTALGAAFLVAKPYLEEWWAELNKGAKQAIPEATDKVERLTDAVKKDRAAIEETKKARELDFFEMQKYTAQVEKLRREEEELANTKAVRSVGQFSDKKSRARAGAFREAVGEYGGGERLVEGLVQAGLDQKEAEKVVASGLGGDVNAIERVQGWMRRLPGAEFQYQSPEAKDRAVRQREITDARLKENAARVKEEQKVAEEQHKQGMRDEERARREADKKLKADVDLSHRVAKAARKPDEHIPHIPLMHVDPIMAAGGPMAVGQVQQEMFQRTGQQFAPAQVAHMMLQQQRMLQQAQAQYFDATLQQQQAIDAQIQQLRQATRAMHRGGRRPVTMSAY